MSDADVTGTCIVCFKSGNDMLMCSRCRSTAYCSRDCQKADWRAHKPSCKAPAAAAATAATGERRLDRPVVVLADGANLQSRLDGLNTSGVRVLSITGRRMGCEGSRRLRVDQNFPDLEELRIEDVALGKVRLTPENTPRLRNFLTQNPTPDDVPDFVMDCPKLRELSIFHWTAGHWEWLHDLLCSAKELELFDSFKIWGVRKLTFASNALRRIRLHRCDGLLNLELWAPRIEHLDVQAAYDLEDIRFIENVELRDKLPSGFTCSAPLRVTAVNANLGAMARENLLAHPRVTAIEGDAEYTDETAGAGGLEAHFARGLPPGMFEGDHTDIGDFKATEHKGIFGTVKSYTRIRRG
mmetsp:Transcript_7250/g.17760  ORF Transcript_7250/g.17760 Transcript_7250/m.17760 type:complete len:354 (+) Transcript_7250:173-1234(+)